MSTEKMFETAIRCRYRYPFKGVISTEDLFDLSVNDLDSVYKTLNSELKKATEESLLNTKTKQDKELETKIEIIKYIVKVKQEEELLRLKAKERKEQRQKILEIMAMKQDESLQNKSIEELTAMLNELDS